MDSHAVDVWTIPLDIPRPVILLPEEQARADRFRFESDRVHWSHARSALREILAVYLGAEPAAIRFTYGENGKPATEGIQFNLSHTRHYAMIAISHEIPVGIDIEAIRENVEMGQLLRRIGESDSSESRAGLFQAWARREARTKALGGQLMEIPPPNVIAVDVNAPPGFAAAVALINCSPVVRYPASPIIDKR